MRYVYLAFNWVFGVLLGLVGLSLLIDSPLAGACLIAISLLLLPPIRETVFLKTNIGIPFKARALSVFVLFILFSLSADYAAINKAERLQTQKAEEQARLLADKRRKNIEYFKENKTKILASVSQALRENKHQDAVSEAVKYLPANDNDLNEIYKKAKSELDKIRRAELKRREKIQKDLKTKELLAKAAELPETSLQENIDVYKQLFELHPFNAEYKSELDYYSQKLAEKSEKERREQERLTRERNERIAKFGEAPTQSGWDGSYYPVKQYLKRVANDPDSIEIDGCTDVYHTESGWLVGCDYRGRNAFGGMVRQSNWFTIVYGQVLKMEDASAYRP